MDSIYCGDFRLYSSEIPDSTVQLIFADLPYGITESKWDTLDVSTILSDFWEMAIRTLKPDGAIAIFASGQYVSKIFRSYPQKAIAYKEMIVWVKPSPQNFLHVQHSPLRQHECVLIFSRKDKSPKYNPIETTAIDETIARKCRAYTNTREDRIIPRLNTSPDYPYVPHGRISNTVFYEETRNTAEETILHEGRRRNFHATQKSLAICRYIIEMYTDPEDIIYDPTCGSGSIPLAAWQLGRHYIACELDDNYAQLARDRISSIEFNSYPKRVRYLDHRNKYINKEKNK